MREAKFWAGLGTILIFTGIYCFRALRQRKVSPEEYAERGSTVTKNSNKVLLLIGGSITLIIGILLLIKSFKDLIQ